LRHHDSEEDHGQNQKKSVMTKVKEKAKKLRHSLSKKRHEDWNPISPSSGDGAEEDAEYRGAPSNKKTYYIIFFSSFSFICIDIIVISN
jgi:hypothetical protein